MQDHEVGPSNATRRPHRTRVGQVIRGTIVAAAVAGLAVIAIGVLSGGWQIRPVLSGSMRPGLPIGGVVVTQRVPIQSLQIRDVIAFHPPGEPTVSYVHRIISLKRGPDGLVARTQGDDNLYPDPWTLHLKGHYAYEARFSLPVVGYVAVWMHSPSGRRDLVGAAALAALALGAYLLLGTLAERRGSKRAGVDSAVPQVGGVTSSSAMRSPSVASARGTAFGTLPTRLARAGRHSRSSSASATGAAISGPPTR